jgi:hypothetical protein
LVLTLKGVFDFDKLEVVGSVGAQYLVLVLWLVGFRPALTLPKALRLGGGGRRVCFGCDFFFPFLIFSRAYKTGALQFVRVLHFLSTARLEGGVMGGVVFNRGVYDFVKFLLVV